MNTVILHAHVLEDSYSTTLIDLWDQLSPYVVEWLTEDLDWQVEPPQPGELRVWHGSYEGQWLQVDLRCSDYDSRHWYVESYAVAASMEALPYYQNQPNALPAWGSDFWDDAFGDPPDDDPNGRY